jgi:DNA-binding NtrC family response regulator
MQLPRFSDWASAAHLACDRTYNDAWEKTIVETAHILVVDDEEAIREVVSTMLESRGYKCTTLSTGRAAQEFVRKQTPDLVLSDTIMPEMDGIQLLDWLRGYNPEIPVIMVTTIHDISTALQAIRRGAYD